jgi:hypothetical protein
MNNKIILNSPTVDTENHYTEIAEYELLLFYDIEVFSVR